MKKLFLLLVFLFCMNPCFAFDIVYPKKTMVNISADSSFFIGSVNPDEILKINGEEVKVHSGGGFAYPVKLNNGKNVFTVESESEKIVYIINRPIKTPQIEIVPFPFKEFTECKSFVISNENAPIRSTPVNNGINRLSHFQEDIPLLVDGEDREFYRVVLNDNTKAWVYKGDVKFTTADYCNYPATVNGYEHIEDNEYDTFIFNTDKKTPYVIKEGNPLTLTFYNVKNNGDLTYVFEFPVNKKIYGYSGKYDNDKFVLKVRKYPEIDKKMPLKDINIAIDPGHGGNESGAIGCGGEKEKDINLAISLYLEEELKSRGAKVIMTRDDDRYLELYKRIETANNEDASILLSIHANALPDCLDPNKYRGTSIYYYYGQAKPLADSVLKSMVTNLGTVDDKVRQGSLALVRNTQAVSILIEVAYMINPVDITLLTDKCFQKNCARAIADGIENYLKQN